MMYAVEIEGGMVKSKVIVYYGDRFRILNVGPLVDLGVEYKDIILCNDHIGVFQRNKITMFRIRGKGPAKFVYNLKKSYFGIQQNHDYFRLLDGEKVSLPLDKSQFERMKLGDIKMMGNVEEPKLIGKDIERTREREYDRDYYIYRKLGTNFKVRETRLLDNMIIGDDGISFYPFDRKAYAFNEEIYDYGYSNIEALQYDGKSIFFRGSGKVFVTSPFEDDPKVINLGCSRIFPLETKVMVLQNKLYPIKKESIFDHSLFRIRDNIRFFPDYDRIYQDLLDTKKDVFELEIDTEYDEGYDLKELNVFTPSFGLPGIDKLFYITNKDPRPRSTPLVTVLSYVDKDGIPWEEYVRDSRGIVTYIAFDLETMTVIK